jgi:hypothetical protein
MQLKTSSLLVAVILAACLMALGAVSPALAATPSQADDAGAMQVWASSVYPAADAPGMISFVALYPNNAAEVVTIYLDKGDINEIGTWETGDDGAVLITLTGNADREYNEPTTMTLTPEADMMSDGVFTYHALAVVTPEEMDALTEGAEDEPAASNTESSDTASDTAEVDSASDMRRIWVSNVQPAADASGLITILALYDNGNMSQYSVYLGKGVISEIGIWEEDAGDAISVTATGTLDEEYTEANTTTYQHTGDTLVDGALVLTLWPEVSPEQMANAVDPSGVYGSNVYPAADAAGYVMVLALYDNNNAEQTTIYLTKGANSEVGTWAEEIDGSITVTMTGTVDKEYDEPAVTLYSRSGEILQDGVFMLFKLQEITPEMMDAMTTPAVVTVYQSDTMPAASSPGRVITLTLFDDGSITLDTDFLNDEPVIAEVGEWEENADGALTVSITGTADEAYDEPDVITFEKEGDQMVAVEYDESLWGSEGLTLTAQPAE